MRLLGRSEEEIAGMDWRTKSDMATVHSYVSLAEHQMFAKILAGELAQIILPAMGIGLR